jgi:hypothetical protein
MGTRLPVLFLMIFAPCTVTAQNGGGASRTIAAVPVVTPTYVPMTASQRLHEYLKGTVNPRSFVAVAAGAGWGQWRDRPKEWHQGAEGYGKRYASGFGEHITRQSLMYGFSSAFHEDNRYVKSGETGFGKRLGYALENSIMARGDDGTRHVSLSKIVAYTGAALLSRLWQPHATRSFRSAGVNLASTAGSGVAFEVVREFWPSK